MRNLATIAASFVTTFPCLADAQTPVPTYDTTSLQDFGNEARRRNDNERALRAFQLAYETVSEPMALARIGLTEFALGRFADAEVHLADALARTSDPWIAQHTADILPWLDRARAQLGTIAVVCSIPRAELWVDGVRAHVLAARPAPSLVRVQIGERRFEVRAEGYRTRQWNARVAQGPSPSYRLEASLARDVEPTPVLIPPRRPPAVVGPLVLMGAGGLGVGTALIFESVLRRHELDRYGTACPNLQCTPDTLATAQDAVSNARTYATASLFSVALGAAALAGGVTWWFVSRVSSDAPPRTAVSILPSYNLGGAALSVSGVF